MYMYVKIGAHFKHLTFCSESKILIDVPHLCIVNWLPLFKRSCFSIDVWKFSPNGLHLWKQIIWFGSLN